MPPAPPSNIVVTNQSAMSISLSWNTGFNGNSPLENVNITYCSSNYPNEGTQYLLLPLVYSATLSGLHPNANYSIRITLVNTIGLISAPVTIATSTLSLSTTYILHTWIPFLYFAALGAPVIRSLYAISSTQLAVRWMVSAHYTSGKFVLVFSHA